MPERFALPIHAFMLTGNLYRLQIETPRRPMAQPVLQLLGKALGIIVGTAPRGPSFRDALFFLRYCQKLCIEAWRILVEMID